MKAHLCCALICFFGVANFVENRICVVESFVVSSSSTLSLSSTSSSISRPLSWNDRHRYWHHSAAAAVLVLNDAVQNIRGEIDDEWKGEVVPGGSMMRGCTIQEAKKEDNNNENESSSASAPCTEFVIRIDGVEADLGRFSNAIYKQLMIEAKQQRFQGFRPGTIPPHLYNTYKAYALDETCRETILEAMQQNSIRPFTNARQDMRIEQVSIPPPSKTIAKKKNKKKYKKKKKKSKNNDTDIENEFHVALRLTAHAQAGQTVSRDLIDVPPAVLPRFNGVLGHDFPVEAATRGRSPTRADTALVPTAPIAKVCSSLPPCCSQRWSS